MFVKLAASNWIEAMTSHSAQALSPSAQQCVLTVTCHKHHMSNTLLVEHPDNQEVKQQ